MNEALKKDIKYIPGVGPRRAENLNQEIDVFTFEDLLYYFPYKYIDKSKFFKIGELNTVMQHVQVKGRLDGFKTSGFKRKKILSASFSDESGSIELVWFKGHKWIIDSLEVGKEYIVFGKPSVYNNRLNIAHPEIEPLSRQRESASSGLQPMYNTTEKLKNNYITSRTILKIMENLLKVVKGKIGETLPAYLIEKIGLMPLEEALFQIHFPGNNDLLARARYRLKFEELFYIQLNLLRFVSARNSKYKGFVFSRVGEVFNDFYKKNLPFELTGAQKRVLKEIRKDLGSGLQMNRLLQGDVGSGKTLVALMSMLIAIDNGFQTCLMAPTEILATQHAQSLASMLEGLGIEVSLLTGSTRKSTRERLHQRLSKGEIHILIGTHALIEDVVVFKNLGLVIIDEQHRFGVAQRAKLWKKSASPPHVLVMTATPIPRTLAMTLYGDLDVSVIDELPPGRKPVKTVHYYDSKRLKVFGFLKEQIQQGRQVYVVYPLINESEKLDYKDLQDGYESIVRAFPAPDYSVSILHGKMKPDAKEMEMKNFKEGRTQIMVSTTVIEVGVDVANATVMVIESAERFGLSQLHQLRGRVGRGADQSFCVLMTSVKLTNEARQRMKTMVESNDGFEIAEVDLKLRGPGDLEGTRQSGLAFDLKVANLGKDGQVLQYARDIAMEIIENDPGLSKPENAIAREQLKKFSRGQVDWSDIS